MPAPRTTSKFPVNKYHIYGKSVIIFWSNLQLRVNMHQSTLRKTILATYVRAVASGGAKGTAVPPGPVEPDKSSLWMDLLSLDWVILIVVTCNYYCLHFHFIFEVDFLETYLMTSVDDSVSEPPNLKIFWGKIPPHPPRRYKKPSYGPVSYNYCKKDHIDLINLNDRTTN